VKSVETEENEKRKQNPHFQGSPSLSVFSGSFQRRAFYIDRKTKEERETTCGGVKKWMVWDMNDNLIKTKLRKE